MRHLRLSKLQKEKLKQGKMWDFTVRGWRVATTCDIENLFGGEQTAVLPQRKVRKLQYEDTKIGEAYFSAIAFIVFTLQQIKQGIDLLVHPVWYGMLYYNVLYCTLLYL
jgi:hypothetical protein